MNEWTLYQTPFGPGCVSIVAGKRIARILLPGKSAEHELSRADEARDDFARWVVTQLEAYYRPDATPEDLRPHLLDVANTSFRRAILSALMKVGRGETVTYGELAARAGHDRSSRYGRSVGGVMSWNPLPLAVPCHRVLAHGDKLGGYGGGLAMKRHLLQCEGAFSEAAG